MNLPSRRRHARLGRGAPTACEASACPLHTAGGAPPRRRPPNKGAARRPCMHPQRRALHSPRHTPNDRRQRPRLGAARAATEARQTLATSLSLYTGIHTGETNFCTSEPSPPHAACIFRPGGALHLGRPRLSICHPLGVPGAPSQHSRRALRPRHGPPARPLRAPQAPAAPPNARSHGYLPGLPRSLHLRIPAFLLPLGREWTCHAPRALLIVICTA
ncbi:MAG: hypothetical protein J3K34DRAFT_415696 [Monoraphidium minutum]|nr:MAG: hypothetical protein J3K34DRAFT_415696 [Monoraphidium minutum]